MDTRILRMGPLQAPLLACVADDVFDAAIDPARLSAYLAEPGHLLVVALADGEVVGQARGVVHRQPDTATELYIDNLGVTPARRREGLATRMLDELLDWGRDLGCEAAWVATETDNDAARALYERRGSEAETFVMYFYGFES
jgi:aminoglycoside 6'-N-acetyltransferase I